MTKKSSAGVKIWCVVLLMAVCLGAASLSAGAVAVGDSYAFLRPDGNASVSWLPEPSNAPNWDCVNDETYYPSTYHAPDTSDYVFANAGEPETDIYTLTDAQPSISPGSATYANITIYAYGVFGPNDVIEASYSSNNGAGWSASQQLTPLTGYSGWFKSSWTVSALSGTLSNYQMKLDRTTADAETEAVIYATYMEVAWNKLGDDPPTAGNGWGSSPLYLDPNSLISNSGWTSWPNAAAFVASVNDDPARQPYGDSSTDYISSYDIGSWQEVHTIKFGLEDCAVDATSLTLWFYGSGYITMYPFKVRVMSGATLIQDWTEIDMHGLAWDLVIIDQSLTAAQLNALTVEIKRDRQSNPDKGYSKVYQFYAEVIY